MRQHGLLKQYTSIKNSSYFIGYEQLLISRELKKLSEDSLTKQPEEVFDILCKLGEGSYGSVFKALHKESKQVLAIKQARFD